MAWLLMVASVTYAVTAASAVANNRAAMLIQHENANKYFALTTSAAVCVD